MLKYLDERGNVKVSGRYISPSGFKLGSWVQSQKKGSKNYKEYFEKLDELPGWSWETKPKEEQWEDAFCRLSDWTEEHGHASPHVRLKLDDGFNLGSWVEVQRGNKDNLSAKRRNKLEGLQGWVWSVNEHKWNLGYRELKTFAERNGHARPKSTYVNANGYNLGGWVRKQLAKRDSLTKSQTDKLERLPGWVWRK